MGRKSKLDILKQKGKAKAKSKNVSLTAEITETDPIKPKTKGTSQAPATRSKTAQRFVDDVSKVHVETIRKEMKREVHVLVVNAAQFSSLVRDHMSMIRRILPKVNNPTVKELLQDFLDNNKNLYKLAIELKKEFQIIFEKVLNNRSGILKWKKIEQGQVAIYIIQRFKQSSRSALLQGSAKQTNFDAIQGIMTDVKKELVSNSQSGTLKRVTGIIIGGMDIDYEAISKQGIGKTAKRLFPDRARITSTGKVQAGTGIQLGHFRGPGTEAARRLLNLVQNATSNIVKPNKFVLETERRKELIHSFDAEIRFNDIIYNIAQRELKGEVDISILGLELASKNSYEGTEISRASRQLRAYLVRNAEAIVTVKGSKPIVNMILDDAMYTLAGKKPKKRSINRSAKVRKTVKENTGTVSPKLETKNDINKLNELLSVEGSGYSTLDIITIINNRLEEKIRQNMGKGKSRQKLNWRTGRFGRSAKVRNITSTRSQREMLATVKYYGFPYSRFADKGDVLYKPLRDPKGIFGRSIRQILQEEKLADLRRVKVELRG